MIQKIFTIHDSKAEVFKKTFTANTTGEILRQWQVMANDPETEIGKFPADFTLFEIGTFNLQTGLIDTYESKKSLGTALEYVKQN